MLKAANDATCYITTPRPKTTHAKEAALLLDLGVCKDNRGGQLLARHRIRLVCLEPVLDGLSLESLPKVWTGSRISSSVMGQQSSSGASTTHGDGASVYGMRGVATVHGSAGLAGRAIISILSR